MPLHLVVPGLLWPRESVHDVLRGLALPGLSTLLGRGRIACSAALAPERWLCRAFGIEAEELPLAALRLLGEGRDPGAATWLCADLVQVRFSRDTLVIDAQPPPLEAGETDALVAELNAQLGAYGELIAAHPQRLYLRAARPARLRSHSPAAVAGRTLEPFLPQGADAADWRHFINESQVILHNHPINTAREESGMAMANSLWPWGAGRLPAPLAAGPAPARLAADGPLAAGLARWAGIEHQPAPSTATTAAEVAVLPGLTFLDALAVPAQGLDAGRWRAALAQMERDWFAPLLARLRARRLDALRITALGDEATLDLHVRRADLWRLWRRPQALAEATARAAARVAT